MKHPKSFKVGTLVKGVPDDVARKFGTKYARRMMFLNFAAEAVDAEESEPTNRKIYTKQLAKHDKYEDLVDQRFNDQIGTDEFVVMMYNLSLEKQSAYKLGDLSRLQEAEYRMKRLDDDSSYLWELFLEKKITKAVAEEDDAAVNELINEYHSTQGKSLNFQKEFEMRDLYFEMEKSKESHDYAKAGQLKQKLDSMHDPNQMLDSPLREYFAGSNL